MSRITTPEKEFIRQSNYIENEWTKKALNDAVEAWRFLKMQEVLSVSNILMTHDIIMTSRTTIDDVFKGKFRTYNVMISGHPERRLADWQMVPSLIEQWVMNVNDLLQNRRVTDDPVFIEGLIKQHHIKFETIHPFGDGNGRIGRLLLLWERYRVGLPVLIIRNDEKAAYYRWFEEQDKLTPIY